MPTASPELRNRWMSEEDAGGDQTAMTFLNDRGYRLRRDWTWLTPTPDHVITEDEDSAILFLMMEWDFGGVTRERTGLTPDPVKPKKEPAQ